MDLPLGLLAAIIVLAALGFSMFYSNSSRNERFETLQDKFKREVRFVPRGDQWHIDRRRGIGPRNRFLVTIPRVPQQYFF